jgi:hypothetical protein
VSHENIFVKNGCTPRIEWFSFGDYGVNHVDVVSCTYSTKFLTPYIPYLFTFIITRISYKTSLQEIQGFRSLSCGSPGKEIKQPMNKSIE